MGSFIAGFIIGGVLGTFAMALCKASGLVSEMERDIR